MSGTLCCGGHLRSQIQVIHQLVGDPFNAIGAITKAPESFSKGDPRQGLTAIRTGLTAVDTQEKLGIG